VVVEDTCVYAGGQFVTLGGRPRAGIGAAGASGAMALPFVADLNGEARRVVVRDGVGYIAGACTSVSGVARNCLAAVDARIGLEVRSRVTAGRRASTRPLPGPRATSRRALFLPTRGERRSRPPVVMR
jgi:hypothetical protein